MKRALTFWCIVWVHPALKHVATLIAVSSKTCCKLPDYQYPTDIVILGRDYIDACERLSQLSLLVPEVQQGEVIRVLQHCCSKVLCSYLLTLSSTLRKTRITHTIFSYASSSVAPFMPIRQRWNSLYGVSCEMSRSNMDGAAAAIKDTRLAAKEDVEFEVKSIPKTRIQHVSNVYDVYACHMIGAR